MDCLNASFDTRHGPIKRNIMPHEEPAVMDLENPISCVIKGYIT